VKTNLLKEWLETASIYAKPLGIRGVDGHENQVKYAQNSMEIKTSWGGPKIEKM